MILQCEFKNSYNFIIDIENKIIEWDNRKGHLEKLIADHGEYIEVILTGVYAIHKNGNSYMTPHIFKEDITECNDWDTLEKLYTV
jgi:hypothetical protein